MVVYHLLIFFKKIISKLAKKCFIKSQRVIWIIKQLIKCQISKNLWVYVDLPLIKILEKKWFKTRMPAILKRLLILTQFRTAQQFIHKKLIQLHMSWSITIYMLQEIQTKVQVTRKIRLKVEQGKKWSSSQKKTIKHNELSQHLLVKKLRKRV